MVSTENSPFKILGTADDGKAYFLDRSGRIMVTALESLTQNKLLKLAGLDYWKELVNNSRLTRDDWLSIQDELIGLTLSSGFDPKSIRGRGAWREANGQICYHNGDPGEILGKPDEHRLYIKKNKIDIGLKSEQADKKICHSVRNTLKELQFVNGIDRYRVSGWALLAPFAGALPFRPACMLTGPSESGKSSISDYVLRPLALDYRQWEMRVFNGGSTTVPGMSQHLGNDSGPVFLEEAEGKGKKAKELREEQFSYMRQSTSDDAPQTAKGTADGSGVSYANKNMFLFISISPIIEEVADANRITLINLKIPDKSKWASLKVKLKETLSMENCRRIRALTWSKLPDILEIADQLAEIIQEQTRKNHRSAFGDALLISAYLQIFEYIDKEKFTQSGMEKVVEEFYKEEIEQERRDDTEEIIKRILDETIITKERDKLTVRQALCRIKTGRYNYAEEKEVGSPEFIDKIELREYKQELSMMGIALVDYRITDEEKQENPLWKNYGVAIENDHHKIIEISKLGKGYSKVLTRYKGGVKIGHSALIGGATKRCTLLFNLIPEADEKQMEFEG